MNANGHEERQRSENNEKNASSNGFFSDPWLAHSRLQLKSLLLLFFFSFACIRVYLWIKT